FGGGQPQREAPSTQQGPFDNPLGKIFEEMMRGGQQQTQPRQQTQRQPQPQPQSRGNPSGRARTPYDDLFGDMFESGRKTRDDYQKNMESVFDQFLQGMKNPQR